MTKPVVNSRLEEVAACAWEPEFEDGRSPAEFLQDKSGWVVKNTFLDWEEEDVDAKRKPGYRAIATEPCVAKGLQLTDGSEPEAEVSPVKLIPLISKETSETCYSVEQFFPVEQGVAESPKNLAEEDQKAVRRRGCRGGVRRNRKAVKEQVPITRSATDPQISHSKTPVAGQFRHGPQQEESINDGWRSQQNRRIRSKVWCHFYINPCMLLQGFDLNKKIIGREGCCTRQIFDATGAKIRLRGYGSGHLEDLGCEAPAPLMLAITGENGRPDEFGLACKMSADLLNRIAERFRHHVRKERKHIQNSVPPFWVGEVSIQGATIVKQALEDLDFPVPCDVQPQAAQ